MTKNLSFSPNFFSKIITKIPLSTSRIGRDDDGGLPVGNRLLDVLEDGRLRVQIVHGNVEKALKFWFFFDAFEN